MDPERPRRAAVRWLTIGGLALLVMSAVTPAIEGVWLLLSESPHRPDVLSLGIDVALGSVAFGAAVMLLRLLDGSASGTTPLWLWDRRVLLRIRSRRLARF